MPNSSGPQHKSTPCLKSNSNVLSHCANQKLMRASTASRSHLRTHVLRIARERTRRRVVGPKLDSKLWHCAPSGTKGRRYKSAARTRATQPQGHVQHSRKD
eukprot:3367449-Pleurochrysis_carterae.AAC.2